MRISAGELGLTQLLPEEKPTVPLDDGPPPLESVPAEEEVEQLEGVLRRVWEVLVQVSRVESSR